MLTVLSALLGGCDSYVDKSKYEAIHQELLAANTELAKSQEALRRANEEIAKTKPGRYQNFSQGYRQWRLDTATGSSCIILASSADWKDPNVKRQGCECEDQLNRMDGLSGEAWKIQDSLATEMGCFGTDKPNTKSK